MSHTTPPQSSQPSGDQSSNDHAATRPFPATMQQNTDQQATQAYPTQQAYPAQQQAYPAQQQPSYPAATQVKNAQPTTLAYTNTYALLAIVFAFIAPLAGIIFGHLALGQIKRNGDAGRGIGLTGLIISYAYFVVIALIMVAYIGMIVVMFGAMGAAFSDFDSMSGSDYYY